MVQADPRTWLLLATGLLDVGGATDDGRLHLSGSRAADIAEWFPLVKPGQ